MAQTQNSKFQNLFPVLILILMIMGGVLFDVVSADAMKDWTYAADIIIDNTGGTEDLTGYQVLVELNSTNFDFAMARLNGDDIRFTLLNADPSSTSDLLPYWIESYDQVSEEGRIWVKVDSILTSEVKTITMHYGNPDAEPASSGTETFEFFDDFEVFNTAFWDTTHSTVEVSNGYLRIYYGTGDPWHGCAQHTYGSAQDNLFYTVRWRNPSSDTGDPDRGGIYLENGHGTAGPGGIRVHPDKVEIVVGGGTVKTISQDNINIWRTLGIGVTGSTVNLYVDGDLEYSTTTHNPATYPLTSVRLAMSGYNHEEHADDFRVRKYTDPEPTVTVGGTPVLTTIVISPDSASLNIGDTQQFTATGYDQYGGEMTGITFTWSSNDEEVGTVDSDGLFTAIASGSAIVTASSVSVEGSASVTITPPHSDWPYTSTITIDNSGNPEALTDYQVLVELDNKNFDFTKAQPDGEDIRFTLLNGDPSITGDLLPYWIETFDPTGETAKIWVKVDSIPASNTKNIIMHYGNLIADPATSGPSTFELYNVSGIAGFWHMDEDSWSGASGEVKDETGVNDGTAQGGASTSDGKFNRAGSFDGNDDYVDCGTDSSLVITNGITVESWVKINTAETDKIIVHKDYETNSYSYALRMDSTSSPTTVKFYTDTTTGYHEAIDTSVPINEWVHLVGVYDKDNGKQRIYTNGFLKEEVDVTGTVEYDGRPLYIGGIGESKPPQTIDGAIDECDPEIRHGYRHNCQCDRLNREI